MGLSTVSQNLNLLEQEGLIEKKRLFGFPDDFSMEIKQKDIFDLFGNTVAVPVVKAVSLRLLDSI